MPFREPKIKLSKEEIEIIKKSRYDKFRLGDDGFDADGHYDETKDRRSIEDLLKDYPKELEEYREMMRKHNEKDSKEKE